MIRAQSIARILRSGASAHLIRSPAAIAARWSGQSATGQNRTMTTVAESPSAADAWKRSCYVEIDFTIGEDQLVFEAVQRFVAYDIGCLITVDEEGK